VRTRFDLTVRRRGAAVLRGGRAVTRTRLIAAFAVALTVTLVSRPAAAQSVDEPDPARVRVRLGPLWMTPAVAMTNIGVDNNVFNEPDSQNPKSDFTFTLTPALELWLRVGPTWIAGKIVEDVNWYQTYASERNASTGYTVGWRVPLARLGFKVDASLRNARDRPGFEIDARVDRTEAKFDGLVELRVLSKTYIGVTAERQKVNFNDDAVFVNTVLQTQLDHTTTGAGLSLRHQLTPLTSLSLTATRSEDRFEFSPLRDSSSTTIAGNVNLDKFALIRGSASVGVTNFHPDSPDVPDFDGVTASASLSYTLLGSTRFTFDLGRDVEYSYDVNQPYYVQTRVGGSVAQQIFGPVDVVVRGSTATLAYRDREGAAVLVQDRVDTVNSYGAGVGYHIGRDARLGFNVDNTTRSSDLPGRRYNNLTFGSSVTYGF
jgi:putative beta-barrel porin BBP2